MSPVIPSIRITPASPEKIDPFAKSTLNVQDDDGYRSKWLSLPPNASHWRASPLRPASRLPGRGLSRDQFNSLLKLSRDQRAKLSAHNVPELCHRSALGNQTLKQQTAERRTRFLSKIKQPTCPVTMSFPATPVCFASEFSGLHVAIESAQDFTLVSPSADQEWDEHGLPIPHFSPAMPEISRHSPPTLDEITSRLRPAHQSSNKDCSRSRLPHFLKAQKQSPSSAHNQIKTFPVRSLALNDEKFNTTFAQQPIRQHSSDLCTSEKEAHSYSPCAR